MNGQKASNDLGQLRCSSCEQWLMPSAFSRVKTWVRGYSYKCKACTKDMREKTQYNKQYHARNKERINTYHQEHYASNKEGHFERMRMRRVRILNNGLVERISLNALFDRDKGICQICKTVCCRNDASIDHIHPVAKGGTHTWNNVQLAHLLCNKRKSASVPTMEYAGGN